ncbi:flagellar basal body-associated FliL family protein [Bacillus sp. M6-12]|uniref:flagellar basal body-associated FliL family protein n=1 Tax=Bacillus sp. M6-12 TaxID=2054166 RepID=UPI0015E0B7C7|nr:flagellar basal body-associated FliL family protein [Bacillus sp. M6-12]
MASKESKESKPASSGLVKFMFFLLTLLIIVVGYLFYQIFTSEAMGKNADNAISSIFHKEEKEILFPLDEFTVKLSDGSFAKLSVNLGFVGKEEKVKELKPILRDKIIFEMMKLKPDQMNVKHIEGTKGILIENLNPIMEKENAEVKSIYIDNLIVQ